MASTAPRSCHGHTALGVVVLLLLLVGCTNGADPSPAPSPSSPPVVAEPSPDPVLGLRVGVVLPARDGTDEAVIDRMVADLEALERSLPDEVSELRTVVPDQTRYVADAVAVLADDGYGLVCVVGPTAASAVGSLAGEFPRSRFCVLPARLRAPAANVLAIDVRVEEFSFLAGAAAARPSGAGPVLVVGPGRPTTERQRTAFRAGVERVRGSVPEQTRLVPVADGDAAYTVADAAYDEGTFVIVTDAGAADREVLRAAREQGRVVVGHEATLRAQPEDGASPAPISPSVLLLLRERLDVPVRLAVERALGDWEGGSTSVGFAEGALELVGGGSAIWPVIEAQVVSLRNALVAGDLVVPTPP